LDIPQYSVVELQYIPWERSIAVTTQVTITVTSPEFYIRITTEGSTALHRENVSDVWAKLQ